MIDCPKCGSDNTKKNGTNSLRSGERSVKVFCRTCGKFTQMSEAKFAEALAARGGLAPEHGLNHPYPIGFKAGQVTIQRNAEGGIERTWERMRPDDARLNEMLEAAVLAFSKDLPRVAPIKPKGSFLSDLLTVYPIGDPHVGMYSWGAETGDDWDLNLAERIHCNAMNALVEAAPATETAVVINLGDLLHYDSMDAKTPRSGHMLDADGRYAKMLHVAVSIMRQCIESARRKHKHVHVINAIGNHDETGALAVAGMLAIAYENEPRVTVELRPSVFHYYRWHKVLLGIHHGHTCRAEKLPGVMAADRARDWGETKHRHWLMGHIHHASMREYPGVKVESFGTLAGKDAYATNGGWRSSRNMQALVYHREHGEVARSCVNADMFGE